MPKMKNVSADDLKIVEKNSEDVLSDILDVCDRVEKGYVDDIEDPVALARHFTALARAASQAAGLMLFRLQMQKQSAELAELKKRVG